MKKTTTAIRLDNHEKLCRIMQKQTHDKINSLATQINRLEKILIGDLINKKCRIVPKRSAEWS